ncbi:uncharacterized protein SPSK_10831 [Sporothrix schenckii 1099-18]|uniref:Uncharacterized protein n=1 Tax=Sporothrix schenckii 1099-18 TaxID=1397361 RepID=A0A0F2MHF1_SPOSC|nr:uncharacterized protein SPSK_10831 [Sporothrix schenckii 1099-18]KJR88290.1 hypothetical protein SPSK_10831 [Sporothrix schenckii 1099-18]
MSGNDTSDLDAVRVQMAFRWSGTEPSNMEIFILFGGFVPADSAASLYLLSLCNSPVKGSLGGVLSKQAKNDSAVLC